MNRTPNRRVQQVLQRWKVVAAFVVLAVLAAAAYSLTSHTSFTARSALILAGRAPEQDAVAVQGFVSIFNDAPTVARLRTTAKIPEDVSFEARTAAASPILIIEATADRSDVAQDAAENMAKAFRSDINTTQQEGKQKYLDDLQSQLSRVGPITPNGMPDPYYATLQERIDNVESDTTNQLQLFQPRLGVEEKAPNIKLNVATGLVGGLVLGSLAALALAALSRRVKTAADLRERTGVETLVEVPAARPGDSNSVRDERLRTLANIVGVTASPKPEVIAVTDSQGGQATREVAEALAVAFAKQGRRTVLVHADNDLSDSTAGAGFNGALTDSGALQDALRATGVDSLQLLPAGPSADLYALATRERIERLLDQLREGFDTVVLAAAPIGDATEAQLLCAAADATILVVIRDSSRFADISSAADTLAKLNARLLGAVLIDGTTAGQRHRRSRLEHSPTAPRPVAANRDAPAPSGSQEPSTPDNAPEPIA